MLKFFIFLICIFSLNGKLTAQEQAEPAAFSKEEEMVLQLAADEVEMRDAAYKEIFKDPKTYLKYLRLAAKSDDPELLQHSENLLFFAKAGIKHSMSPQLIESVVNLKKAPLSKTLDVMSNLLQEYTAKRSLKEDEYMVLINLYTACSIPVDTGEMVSFILQQVAQAFKLPKISDKEPLAYVNYLLNKSPYQYAFNKIVGCLFALQGDTSKAATSSHLVNAWRDLLLDPIAYEGRIRGRHTSAEIENTLDIALCRTDQLQRIFIGQSRDEMYPIRNLSYEWMHQSQLGKNPDRNEYLGKMMTLYFGMNTRPENFDIVYSAALSLLGGMDDPEVFKKHMQGVPGCEIDMYVDLIGYPTLESVKAHAQKLIESIKKGPKNQIAELFTLMDLLSFLEGTEELELMHLLCVELFPLLEAETLQDCLSRMSPADRSRLRPAFQCELVDYAPSLAHVLMDQAGLYTANIDDARLYQDALLRLFGDLSPKEQYQIFLLTQRKTHYGKGFLEGKMQALAAKLKAGSSYKIDDLCLLSEYLYITDREELAVAIMEETKEASSDKCFITLYYTVLKLIEKGDISAAEAFFNRYNQQIYSLNSSYYLAASEIAKAKKDTAKAAQYLTYAQVLYLLHTGAFGGDGGIFVANLLRGDYLPEAERVQQMFAFSSRGIANNARMGDMYLERGDWYKARFYFECERYASLVRSDLSHDLPMVVYLIKSELAQAMFYMKQGELDKAQPHIDMCLKKLVCRPSMAEEILGVLCGPSAVATSEQKKQWRDQMLHQYQDLHKKYSREAAILPAIQYLQALNPKTVSILSPKRFETDRSWIEPEPARSWTYRGNAFEGSICFRSPNSVSIRLTRDGGLRTYFFTNLSKADIAYVRAWDPHKKLKADYAKLRAQNPEAITWLKDAVFGTQLAEVKKQTCIIVYLPSENTAVYKHYYSLLTGKGLRDLLGTDVICMLLTPTAEGVWSTTNAQLLKQAAHQGKINIEQPFIQCIQTSKNSYIALPILDCKENAFLKLLSAELPKKQ